MKVFLSKKVLTIFVISSMLSNIYVCLLKKEYNKFYELDGNELNIKAIVVSNRKDNEYSYEYVIKTDSNKKLLLYTMKKDCLLECGNLILIKGIYSKPEGSRNYKGFDYSQYLKTKGIYGSVKTNSSIIILDRNKGNKIVNICNKIKEECESRINSFLSEKEAALLTGILFGDKLKISEETIQDFQESSLAHILAVSGAHVSYIILGIVFILKKFNFQKRWSYIVTIFILLLYMTITGFTASVTRACIMGIILLISKVLYRKLDFYNSISISVLMSLISNPFTINDIGLILSYSGVLGIVVFEKNIKNILKSLKLKNSFIDIISVTLAVQLVLIPIIMIIFNTLSFAFLLSNLLAMPLLGIIIILGFITLIFSFVSINLANFLAIFLNVFIKALILVSEICSSITFLNITVITPYMIIIFIYYIFIFFSNYLYSIYISTCLRKYERKILEKFKKINLKKMIIALIFLIFIFIIIFNLFNIKHKDLRVNFIDVGQRRLYIDTNTK